MPATLRRRRGLIVQAAKSVDENLSTLFVPISIQTKEFAMTNLSASLRFVRWSIQVAALVLLFCCCSDHCFAQGGAGGGGGGGGQGGQGGQVGGQIPTVPTTGDFGDQGVGGAGNVGTDTGTGTDGGGTETDGVLDTVEPFTLEFDIEDRRNQGFVGATAEQISAQGFVGSPSQVTGPELAEERTIGGNVNNGRGQRNATNSNATLQENGFTVQRQGIRSRLVPSFSAPRTPGFVAASRFQARIVRQPVVSQMAQGITVSVSNRTATMTGVAASQAQREIVKRQLRLEPGVYQIVDQTKITR